MSDGLTVSFWAAEGGGAIARDRASFGDREMKARPNDHASGHRLTRATPTKRIAMLCWWEGEPN